MRQTYQSRANEGPYQFTGDSATGEVVFDGEMRMSGFSPHQLRALAEFYERVTGVDPRSDAFGIGEARGLAEIFERRGWTLKARPYEAD